MRCVTFALAKAIGASSFRLRKRNTRRSVAALCPTCFQIIAIHSRNHLKPDLLGAYRFTFADVRATPEEFLCDLSNHLGDAAISLRLSLRQ